MSSSNPETTLIRQEMDKQRQGSILIGIVIYLGIALLLHLPVFAEGFSLNVGREALIANIALTSGTLLKQIAGYFLAVVILNLLPLLLIITSFYSQSRRIKKLGISAATYFSFTSLCFWIAVISFNANYYPRSAFSILLPFGNDQQSTAIGIVALAIFVVTSVFPAILAIILTLPALLTKPVAQIAMASLLVIAITLPIGPRAKEHIDASNGPDIIIIGIDSVSPLHLEHYEDKFPVLRALLKDSSQFTNTITPLARTFPAWVTILSGKYPINHGARFNLTKFDQINTRQTLAGILQERGYRTIYAQDERKFNNLDETFGFDTTVGPKPGAAEFILTNISDHPLANLALLLPGSEWLFPFIKLNRADDIHYEPAEFVNEILDKLPHNENKPLFLATHFCLVHYPYTWRTQGKAGEDGLPIDTKSQHARALESLESQIRQLLDGLKARGRLDNTILVMLSDHGESLAYTDGLWPIASTNQREFNNINKPFNPTSSYSGHGSVVLDRTQYSSVLAFTGYGPLRKHFPAAVHDQLASLADVMPTILDAAAIPAPHNIDGINLMATASQATSYNRTVPAETGITFTSLASIANLNNDEILKEAQKYYAVDNETARLHIKSEFYQDLVSRKDIAIHSKDWMLAFLRQDLNMGYERITMLIHKPSGKWTLGADTELIAQAPINLLAEHAHELYSNEINDFKESWAFQQNITR